MTNYSNYEVEDFLHDDFFIDWVLKGTPQHNMFWETWLLNNPGKKKLVEKARSVISSITVKPLDATLSDAEVDGIVEYVKNRLHEADGGNVVAIKFYRSIYFKIAAMLLVLVSVGFLFVKLKPTNAPQVQHQADRSVTEYLSVVNTSANSKVVQMSDGSLAVLKPGSGLKYLRSFAKKRDVILDGEAFFEVHKNHAIPFLVHSNDMVVRVLGTSFTVKSQKGKQAFNVIVNTGKVLVYDNKKAVLGTNSQNSVTLVPNQQLTYQPQQLKFKKETLQVPLILSEEAAPKEFTFDNTPFSVIVEKISKVYDVDIEYDKAKLGNISINASISQKPLDEKVKLICKAVNATYEFVDGRIVISVQN